MILQNAFLSLIRENALDTNSVEITIRSLVKKLNSVYYNINDNSSHFVLAGSLGRGTAVSFSDIDFCYILPRDVYVRFCNRSGQNIQSQLLREIKEKVESRYPNSEIKADGQVVDAKFKTRLVELVPSFEDSSNSGYLKYPDTHNNGSWQITNPKAQKIEVDTFCKSYPIYRDFCKIIRCWRNEWDVSIKGIEIDILVMEFLKIKFDLLNKKINEIDILNACIDFFDFISNLYSRSYQIIGEYNPITIRVDNFRKKAKKSANLLREKNTSELWDNCINLFGQGFPNNSFECNGEQFIQQLFPIKIRYKVKIDCIIDLDGFRPRKLSQLLSDGIITHTKFVVEQSKMLTFKIDSCDVPKPFEIYWKVRNVGEEAIKRNDIRGTIFHGKDTKVEHSCFHGPHYVECYIVKDGKCVAKDRIDVPII